MSSERLRKLLHQPGILAIPGVFDALGARLAEQSGFQAVLAGGYAVSAGLLGLPDLGLITLNEMLDTVRRMHAVVEIPIIAGVDAFKTVSAGHSQDRHRPRSAHGERLAEQFRKRAELLHPCGIHVSFVVG